MSLIRVFIQNKFFIFFTLIIWFVIGGLQLSIKIRNNSRIYQTDQLKPNINFLLEYLSKLNLNLILIDPFVLDYLFIQHLPLKYFQKRLITFGIYNNSLSLIHPLYSLKNCTIQISKTSSIDHIFIEINQQFIHLAILHEQKTYFLIEKNHIKLPNDIKLSFGDTTRVVLLNRTELSPIKNKFSFSFPRNISHFLWLYNVSEFIQCNRILANEMENKYRLYQNDSQLNLTIAPMRNIAYGLNQLEKHYWLAGGTLLGKHEY